MKDIIQELTDWGCDTASALERFDQDRDLYVECLKIFASDENFAALKEALEAKNTDSAFNAAHALKGVAGNLSLGILYQDICTVSDALKAGDMESALLGYPEVEKTKRQYDDIVLAE